MTSQPHCRLYAHACDADFGVAADGQPLPVGRHKWIVQVARQLDGDRFGRGSFFERLAPSVSPEWVRRSVPGKITLGHSTVRWYDDDVWESA